jgi:GH15 family glucan-1,4-alpha-glucosidase
MSAPKADGPLPPTLDLGVVGNCVLSALIDRQGRFVWCCFPRLDSDPIFCGLLRGANGEDRRDDDERAEGFLSLDLDRHAHHTQSYVGNTAILTTTLTDTDGQSLRITDFAPRFKQYDRIFRPQMLIRRLQPITGACRIRLRIRPRFAYGERKPRVFAGSNHIDYTADDESFRITTDGPISLIAGERWFVCDRPITLILGTVEGVPGSISHMAQEFYDRTLDYWNEWTRYLSVPFEWQDAVIRAAVTLKLCAFEETGGIVAAMTTSIPEAPGTERTWDYRYCWLRDAYFVVHSLNILGATLTMEDFIRYVTNVAAHDPERLRPVYGIVPGTPMPERFAPGLAGYRGMGPVRIGNLADRQVQNDSYGNVVLAATQMFFDRRLPVRGDLGLFRRLEALGEHAAAYAFEPDAGLWEFRGRRRVHTHSAMMCWAACDRLAKIATVLGIEDRQRYWREHATRIRTRLLAEAWNPTRGTFVESLGGSDLDASLLLMHEVGFVAPDDPRFLATVEAIGRELVHGNHVFRYVAPDDFGRPTTAFTITTFWYIDALAAIGRVGEARAIFESVLACRNHLGLLSEGLDPVTGELWGNYPQAYSLVGLVVSARRLSRSWEEAFWRGS